MSQNNHLKTINDWSPTLNIFVGIHPSLAGQGAVTDSMRLEG